MSAIIKSPPVFLLHSCTYRSELHDYNLNKIFFDDLGLREPDHYLGVVGKPWSDNGMLSPNPGELMSAVNPMQLSWEMPISASVLFLPRD